MYNNSITKTIMQYCSIAVLNCRHYENIVSSPDISLSLDQIPLPLLHTMTQAILH